MKQFYLKSLLLALFALVGGVNSIYAQDVEPELTLDFTKAWTKGDTNGSFNTTIDGTQYVISGTGDTNFKFNSGYFIFGKKDAYINLPVVDFAVEKIVVVGNSGASSAVVMNMYVGETAVSTATTGSTGTNTYQIAEDYQSANTQYTLKVTSSHNAQVTYIKYYKKEGEDPSGAEKTKVTLSESTLSFNLSQSTSAVNLTASVTDLNGNSIDGATVTWSSDNEEVATVDDEGNVTPVAAGTANITASYAGVDEVYKASSAVCAVEVIDVKSVIDLAETGTVTFSDFSKAGSGYENGAEKTLSFKGSNEVEYLFSGVNIMSSSGLQFKSESTTYLNLPTIKNNGGFKVTIKANKSGLSINEGTNTETTNSTEYAYIFNGNSADLVFKNPSSNAIRVTEIKIEPKSADDIAAPTLSLEAGTYTSAQTLTITAEEGRTIYYTTDNTNPANSETSIEYTDPIEVNTSMTVKAVASDGTNYSASVSAAYVIKPVAPVIDPNGGEYSGSQAVTITQADGVNIYYTTDGTEPSDESNQYNEAFDITENVTVKAVAIDEFGNKSDVVSAIFKNIDNPTFYEETVLNNAFFGTSYSGAGANAEAVSTGSVGLVTVVYDKGTSSNKYINDEQIRFYTKNGLKFSVPEGYAITNITFTKPSKDAGTWPQTNLSASVGSISTSANNTVWTGGSQEVEFTTSDTYRFAPVSITYAPTVTMSEIGWMTYVTKADVEIPTDLKAFIVSNVSGEQAEAEKVTKVQKGTPLVLNGDAGTYVLNVVTEEDPTSTAGSLDDVSGNMLKASDGNVKGNGSIYVFNVVNGQEGFYKLANGKTLAKDKAYLEVNGAGAKFSISFADDDDTTSAIEGVESIERTDNGAWYNLQGVRVAQPQKGIYIHNGKKVVIR